MLYEITSDHALSGTLAYHHDIKEVFGSIYTSGIPYQTIPIDR